MPSRSLRSHEDAKGESTSQEIRRALVGGTAAFGWVTLESFGFGARINVSPALASFNCIDRVKIVLGSGTDSVHADGLLLSDKLIFKTGLGDDTVEVTGNELERLKIDTGGGDDTVLLDGTTVNRRTRILTGWGADEATVENSIFGRNVILEGGMNLDTLHLFRGNQFDKGLEEDFEVQSGRQKRMTETSCPMRTALGLAQRRDRIDDTNRSWQGCTRHSLMRIGRPHRQQSTSLSTRSGWTNRSSFSSVLTSRGGRHLRT